MLREVRTSPRAIRGRAMHGLIFRLCVSLLFLCDDRSHRSSVRHLQACESFLHRTVHAGPCGGTSCLHRSYQST